MRRSPRAECRTPRRRSSWCRSPGRCSRAPSTLLAGAPDRCEEALWVLRRRWIELAAWFTHISSHNVVGVVVDVPGETKVTDFGQPAFRHQNVSGRQVPVDALWQTDKVVDTIYVNGHWGCNSRSFFFLFKDIYIISHFVYDLRKILPLGQNNLVLKLFIYNKKQ